MLTVKKGGWGVGLFILKYILAFQTPNAERVVDFESFIDSNHWLNHHMEEYKDININWIGKTN